MGNRNGDRRMKQLFFKLLNILWTIIYVLFWIFFGMFCVTCLVHGSKASYYNEGIITANGEIFCPKYDFTCASWYYNFGTILKVTNLENGKSCRVRVNDRGPAWWVIRERGIKLDLSERASSYLTDGKPATITVTVKELF